MWQERPYLPGVRCFQKHLDYVNAHMMFVCLECKQVCSHRVCSWTLRDACFLQPACAPTISISMYMWCDSVTLPVESAVN